MCLCLSQDEKLLISSSKDKTIKIWDLKNLKLKKSLNAHEDSIRSICISPDNNFIISSSFDKTVKVHNILDGTVI